MPFSFGPYGIIAILIMMGIVGINELVKYVRKHHH